MKVSEAQIICPDFGPIRNGEGKTVCRHILSDDMCKLPSHFVCELVQYKKKPPVYTSISRTQIWQKCERYWAFNYFWKVEPMKPSPWKAVGQLFSLCRAKIDAGQPWEIPDTLPRIEDKWKLEWILGEYAKLPPEPGTNEARLEYELEKGPPRVIAIGYADKLSSSRKVIHEWKYTVDFDNYDIQAVRLQMSSYFASVPEAEEVRLCLAKKSKLERKMKTPPEKVKWTKGKGEKKCKDCIGGKWPSLTTSCSVCGMPQFKCSGGPTCENGHGGADGVEVPDAIPLDDRDCPTCKGKGKTWTEEPKLYADVRLEDETEKEFKQRLAETHVTPFEFKIFLRSEFDIETDKELIRQLYHRMEDARRFKIFYPNYSHCGDCDFSDVCKSHPRGPGCDEPTCATPGACHLVKLREGKVKAEAPVDTTEAL